MKCGWCQETGVNREHVKRCSSEHYQQKEEAPRPTAVKEYADEVDREAHEQLAEERDASELLDRMAGDTPSTNIDPPSDSQVDYALDLLVGHEWPDKIDEADLRGMARRQVSKLITAVQQAPLKRREFAVDVTDMIPAGRYALYEGTEVKFYQVDKPTEGQWTGRVFVNQLIGAPGNYQQNKVRGMRASRVLTAIAKDPKEAAIRYGKLAVECGRCHSPLTVKASRDRGMGPKCAKKSGWF